MREDILQSLYDWNPWIKGMFPQELAGFPRNYFLEPYLQIPEIKVLEGARRSGKSTLLYQVIQKIIEQGESVLYINFEDAILRNYTLKDIIDTYHIVAPVKHLFLDEIQNCSDWIPYLRTVYDRKELAQIWVSGSNSSFIQKELSTLLTGRNITIKVFPLAFDEYLQFKQVYPKPPFSSKDEALVKRHFLEYLHLGAFPAVALRPVLQKELLLSYFEDFLYKDISSRHEVNHVKIKELAIYLASNSSKPFSYRGCASALNIHPNTVADYCSYFYEIFLFDELYKFDYSLKNQLSGDKKVYMADVGLAGAVSFRFSEDFGRILETLVHSELKRRKKIIYFHKQKHECDFLVKEELRISEALQVTRTLVDPDVHKREVLGLLEAMEAYQLKEGLILTLEEEGEEIVQEDKKILIMPVWKWLLG
ncbi:MAG: ATP-binding protein [Chlamydiae bacterium]|nr:ATP-binding protein [Chlamydiota bacterium]